MSVGNRIDLASARWLVLAAPLTESTFHLVNRDRLAECGGAYLINVGRGAVVQEAALPEALDARWIGGAALDVFETEPLPAGHPLMKLDNVGLTPHAAGITPEAVETLRVALTQLVRRLPFPLTKSDFLETRLDRDVDAVLCQLVRGAKRLRHRSRGGPTTGCSTRAPTSSPTS